MRRSPRVAFVLTLSLLGAARAGEPRSPETLAREIDGLRAPHAPWRATAWRTCLLDGLREAREKKKPVFLWVFIDRPVDDARC
jgi:hypothetical protein